MAKSRGSVKKIESCFPVLEDLKANNKALIGHLKFARVTWIGGKQCRIFSTFSVSFASQVRQWIF